MVFEDTLLELVSFSLELYIFKFSVVYLLHYIVVRLFSRSLFACVELDDTNRKLIKMAFTEAITDITEVE